jgi:hypothetical protein
MIAVELRQKRDRLVKDFRLQNIETAQCQERAEALCKQIDALNDQIAEAEAA